MTPIGAPELRPGRNGAGLLPGRVKPFGETAFLEKSLLQLPEQLIEQVVGLMDEAKQRVGRHLGRGVLHIGGLLDLFPPQDGRNAHNTE